jgi:acetylxylan esterase
MRCPFLANRSVLVAAAVVFGAVVRSAGQKYSLKGGENFNGTKPRLDAQLAALAKYGDDEILRDYCNTGDYMCAKGSKPEALERHLDYFDLYNDEAAHWIIDTVLKSNNRSQASVYSSTATSLAATSLTASSSATLASIGSAIASSVLTISSTATAAPASSPTSHASTLNVGLALPVFGLSLVLPFLHL